MSGFCDTDLIFLISQQRAGSTLLQRILAGHPDVHTTAEPWLMLHPIYALRQKGHQAEYNAELAFEALQDFCDTLQGGQEHYFEGLRRMALYLYGAACAQAGKPYFLDKTPRYYLIIPELLHVFPEARFILLLRNPLAVLASILNTWVKGHWVLLARYRDDLLLAPHRLVEGIELLGDRAIVVRYEDLVAEPASQVQTLCGRLGLDFIPGMEEYGKGEKPPGEMGDPTGVSRLTRPTAEGLDRWLELGHDRQTRHFAEGYLQSLGPETLRSLGYDYHDLESRLNQVPCTQGRLEVPWQQIVEPDPAFRKRIYYVELALLEHRRMVHGLKRWRRARLGR
jgi:hypothetical protein